MRERHARPCDIESVGLGQPSAEAFFFCTASGRLSWQPCTRASKPPGGHTNVVNLSPQAKGWKLIFHGAACSALKARLAFGERP